jgi:hypothetical protein
MIVFLEACRYLPDDESETVFTKHSPIREPEGTIQIIRKPQNTLRFRACDQNIPSFPIDTNVVKDFECVRFHSVQKEKQQNKVSVAGYNM